MHVAHRRRNVCVAHVGLDIGKREDLDGQRSEGVAEIVKDETLSGGECLPVDAGCLHRLVQRVRQVVLGEHPPHLVREDPIVGAREGPATGEPVERHRSVVDHWHRPDLSALWWPLHPARRHVARDADRCVAEVDVAPAKGPDLASPQAGVGGDTDRNPVQVALRSPGDGLDLIDRQDVELTRGLDGNGVDVGRGVGADPADLLGSPRDAAEKDEPLLQGAPRELPLA